MIWCHVPLDSLDDDTWDASAGAKVTTESSESDDEENHMLLLPGPVERVVWVFTRLWNEDSLVQSVLTSRNGQLKAYMSIFRQLQ